MHPLVPKIREKLAAEFGDRPMTCALATSGTDGIPSARTMVLRDLSDDGTLLFVSDRRSRKDDHLRARSECELLFWLAGQNVQIRIRASAVVIDATNDIGHRELWWDRLDPRGTRILSRERGEVPATMEMPATFELIAVTPESIRVEDYAVKPMLLETWKA